MQYLEGRVRVFEKIVKKMRKRLLGKKRKERRRGVRFFVPFQTHQYLEACRGERVQVGERKFGAVLFSFGFFSEFFFFSLLAFSFESSSPFSRERQRSFQSEGAVKRNRSKKRRVVFVHFVFRSSASFFRPVRHKIKERRVHQHSPLAPSRAKAGPVEIEVLHPRR